MQQVNAKVYDIFISHSSKDAKLAVALCHYMETRSLRCWIAPRDIQAGADYGEALVKAIRASKIMVVVFTASSNNSKPVRNEVERAFHHQLAIIPFRTQDIIPEQSFEFFLSATHWLDAINGKAEDYFEALYTNCASLLNIEPQLSTPVGGASFLPRHRKFKMVVALITAITIVLFILYLVSQPDKNVKANIVGTPKLSKPINTPSKSDSVIGRPLASSKRLTATELTKAKAVTQNGNILHPSIPADIENNLNGTTYEQSDGTDELAFTVSSTNSINFIGKVAGYAVSGDIVFVKGTTFKVIKGNVSGIITLVNGGMEVKGNLTVKSSGLVHSISLSKKANEL